jgi:hypothetical protein
LRRRIERGTIKAQRAGGLVYLSHAALQEAGLVDGRTKRTDAALRVRLLVDRLREPPREAMSTWQLAKGAQVHRQSAEVVLAALAAAGKVERSVAGGVTWRWVA